MATNSIAISKEVEATSFWQGAVVVLGRFFFALIFLFAAPNHFTKQAIAFSASQGVPLASIAVPLSGVVAIAGGLSILLGYRAKLGAWGGQKNEPGRRAVGTGRPETRQFVSLAQELYRHGFWKPRGVGSCFAE